MGGLLALGHLGHAEDGKASDKTINTTILSEMAQHGVRPGASIYVAEAALVTEDDLTALGEMLFITCLPATYGACGRLIEEVVGQGMWTTSLPWRPPNPRRTGQSPLTK